MEAKEKLSIVCFSGDYDCAVAASRLPPARATGNRDVTLFFTFWGVNLLKKHGGHRWNGRGLLARLFNFLPGGRSNPPPRRLNYDDRSPKPMTGRMKARNAASLDEMFGAAKELGIGFVACEKAMHALEIKEDLIDEVTELMGVSTFLDRSRDAKVIFL